MNGLKDYAMMYAGRKTMNAPVKGKGYLHTYVKRETVKEKRLQVNAYGIFMGHRYA